MATKQGESNQTQKTISPIEPLVRGSQHPNVSHLAPANAKNFQLEFSQVQYCEHNKINQQGLAKIFEKSKNAHFPRISRACPRFPDPLSQVMGKMAIILILPKKLYPWNSREQALTKIYQSSSHCLQYEMAKMAKSKFLCLANGWSSEGLIQRLRSSPPRVELMVVRFDSPYYLKEQGLPEGWWFPYYKTFELFSQVDLFHKGETSFAVPSCEFSPSAGRGY